MSQTKDAGVIKEIEAGRYREAYLVYARKSTDDADSQKNSIAYQRAECERYARARGFPVAPVSLPGFAADGVVAEHHSAFKEDASLAFGDGNTVQYRVERPKFHRLARFLYERRFKGVIFLCWDRASRNKADDVVLKKLIKAGVDVKFVLSQYEATSSGELYMDMDGTFSAHHSRVTKEKVTLAIERMRNEGLCTHRAPAGYLNNKSADWKPLDPERAPIIKRMFELAAESSWTLSDLRRWAIEQGFTMPPARRRRTMEERLQDEMSDTRSELPKVCRPPSVANIHTILTSPFYTGLTRGNGRTWVRSASHEALISHELFDRVQENLRRRRTSVRYERKLLQPFRGFVRCICGRLYSPYVKKGIVYYGARCDRSCPNRRKSVNFNMVSGEVGKLLSRLALTDVELAQLDAAAVRPRLRSNVEAQREEDGRRRSKLREDLRYLEDQRLTLLRTGVFTPETLTAEEHRLRSALVKLDEPSEQAEVPLEKSIAATVEVSELLKYAAELYNTAKPPRQEQIARKVFSELTLDENTSDFSCVPGLEVFNSRSLSQSALHSWVSELPSHYEEMVMAAEKLRLALAMSGE